MDLEELFTMQCSNWIRAMFCHFLDEYRSETTFEHTTELVRVSAFQKTKLVVSYLGTLEIVRQVLGIQFQHLSGVKIRKRQFDRARFHDTFTLVAAPYFILLFP